jgi:hypothetical protein
MSDVGIAKKLAVLLPADQVSTAMSLINGSTTFASPLAAFPAGINLLTRSQRHPKCITLDV